MRPEDGPSQSDHAWSEQAALERGGRGPSQIHDPGAEVEGSVSRPSPPEGITFASQVWNDHFTIAMSSEDTIAQAKELVRAPDGAHGAHGAYSPQLVIGSNLVSASSLEAITWRNTLSIALLMDDRNSNPDCGFGLGVPKVQCA